MSRSSQRPLPCLIVLLAVATLATVALVSSPATRAKSSATAAPAAFTVEEATTQVTGADGVLRFDVAEDHSRFVWDGNPSLTDGLPEHHTSFITQGYLYPAGTLSETNGVLPDGSPEFPDKVLGQWTCSGWWIGGGDPGETAPWFATHLFNFGSAWGEATLVTTGYDLDDLAVALDRAVTGGSGPYAGAGGVQSEVNLGFNASNGINATYEIYLTKSE